MKKNKATVFLSIILVIMAFALVMTFLRFPIGIKNYNSVIGAVEKDYDIGGGVSYTLSLNKENDNEVKDVDEVLSVLSNRLDELGYKSYSLTALKENEESVEDYSIRIALEKTDSTASDVAAAAAYGSITFYGGATENPSTEIMKDEAALADSRFAGASSANDGTYLVSMVFTEYGYNELISEIKANETYYLKITLGENTLLSGTITADAITNKTVYITSSSEAAARQTAMQIRTGGLEYKYDVSDAVNVSPLLGENAALYAGIALGVTVVALIAGFIAVFGGYGIIASLALLAFSLIEAGMLIAVPNIKLSIDGIVGAGLALILCADGLTIAIKRIREEFAIGKTVKAAIKTGYRRALLPTVNSHVIVGILALIFFAFTSGAANCFAITFGIGVAASLIANLLLSRMFTALVLPLTEKKENFLNLKRAVE